MTAPGSCCEPPKAMWLDVYGADVRPRRHGFECPPDALQMSAWATIVSLLVLYFTLHAPFFDTALFVGLTVPLLVLTVCTVGLKLYLSLSDISEACVFDSSFQRLDLGQLSRTPPDGTEPCYYCRAFVCKTSKHCSVCDKCVPGFDHHCRWLNQCVGATNYRPFFVFLCTAIVSVLYVFAVDLYVLVDACRNPASYKALLDERYGVVNYAAYVSFLGITLAYTGGGALAMGNLLQFHIYLWWTGQTTYDWILAKRQKKKDAGLYVSSSQQTPNEGGCCALKKRRFFKKRAPAGGGTVGEEASAGAMTLPASQHEPIGSSSSHRDDERVEISIDLTNV